MVCLHFRRFGSIFKCYFAFILLCCCRCVCFTLALSTLCAKTIEAYEFLLSGDSVINIWKGCTEWWVWMCFFYLSPLMMVWRWWWFISTSQMCCLFAHKKKTKTENCSMVCCWHCTSCVRCRITWFCSHKKSPLLQNKTHEPVGKKWECFIYRTNQNQHYVDRKLKSLGSCLPFVLHPLSLASFLCLMLLCVFSTK